MNAAGGELSPINEVDRGSNPAERALVPFNLPQQFLQLIRDRAILDRYQGRHHQVESLSDRAPATQLAVRNRDARFFRSVRPSVSEAAGRYRAGLPARFVPLRGYRAPILDGADVRPPF